MRKVFLKYKEEAKKIIVDAAIRVAIRKGYQSMTIEDVAKEVGVTKGALYGYFKNKEELLSEVLIEIVKTFEKTLNFSDLDGDLDSILDQSMDRLLRVLPDQTPLFAELISISGRDPAIQQMLSTQINNNIQIIEKNLRLLQDKKLIPDALDLRVTATISESLGRGLLMQCHVTRNVDEVRAHWKLALKKIMELPSPEGH